MFWSMMHSAKAATHSPPDPLYHNMLVTADRFCLNHSGILTWYLRASWSHIVPVSMSPVAKGLFAAGAAPLPGGASVTPNASLMSFCVEVWKPTKVSLSYAPMSCVVQAGGEESIVAKGAYAIVALLEYDLFYRVIQVPLGKQMIMM